MQLSTRHRPGQVKEAFDRRRLAIGQRETAAQIVKGKNAIEGSSGSAGAHAKQIYPLLS